MFSSVSLGSALGKIGQLPSADRSSSSAILRVPSRPLAAPEILSESERSNFFHKDIKMVFVFLFFLCHAAHSLCHDGAKVLVVRTAGALAQIKAVALKCAGCHEFFTFVAHSVKNTS